jgi:hypothetical protein
MHHHSLFLLFNENLMIHTLWKKKGLRQLALQTQFLNCTRHSQSLYLYGMSANGQVAWVAKLQFIIYMVQLITPQLQTLSQQLIFNYYTISLYLHPWCHANIINSHISIKFWHMALWNIFGQNYFFSKYWSPSSILIVNDGMRLWHVTQSKGDTWHI